MRRHALLWMALAVWCLLPFAGGLHAQTASSQVFTCASPSANAVPARAEGTTELVSDVVVTCTGGFPSYGCSDCGSIPAGNITLTFNANVTSRLLGASGASEALLLLDEPQPGAQFPCDQPSGICTGIGNGVGGGPGYYGSGPPVFTPFAPNNRNVFQGVVGNPVAGAANVRAVGPAGPAQSITWYGIPIDPSGSGTRTFRFTNLRLDMTSATATPQLLSISGFSTNFFINAPLPVPLSSNTPVQVAAPQTTLAASVRDAGDAGPLPSGAVVPVFPTFTSTSRVATLRFGEAVAGAEKPRTVAPFISVDASPPPANQNTPGVRYNSESGFYNGSFGTYGPGGNLGTAGLADTGTRYMAVLSNIPQGFTVYVDLYNSTAQTGPAARLVSTDANGAGAFAATPGSTLVALPVTNGAATAVWEVLRNGTSSPGQYDFGVYLSNLPGLTTIQAPITVQMRYAPAVPAASIPVFTGAPPTQTLVNFVPPPALFVTPLSLIFTGTAGGRNPAAQLVSVTSTSSQFGLGFSISGTGALPLQFQPSVGTTPSQVSVSVNTRGLAAGTTNDTITVASGSGGRASIQVTLVLAPAPQITSTNPSTLLAGSPAFTLTVNGANFTQGTAVQWNGTPLTTSFVNSGQLTAQVPSVLVAAPQIASITAVTPDGSTSNIASIQVGSLTITSISPATVAAGGAGFTMTISGLGFAQGDVVQAGGTTLQPASLTATQITVAVPASLIAQAGPVPISVASGAGQSSNSLTLTVSTPFLLNTIVPAAVTATGPAFLLTLNGVGFGSAATVQVGSSTLQTKSASATQLTVMVPASAIAQPGSLPVTVVNAPGVTTTALALVVNPAPAITAVVPSAATAGSAGLTITVTGTNLPNGATVQASGQALGTTFVSGTQLTAVLPAGLLTVAKTLSIAVVTTDGVTSNSLPFTISATPAISALAPASATVGASAFTLTVTGTNFASGATVMWNGQALSTSFGSTTQLTAQVPASLLAAAGSASVTVVTPDGAASNALPFAVKLPALTGVSLSAPSSATSGGPDQPVTVTIGATYPVNLVATMTLTFTGDGGLPDDPVIQFQNQSRTFTFTVPAGTQPQPLQVVVKTGTVAGVITITTSFSAGGTDVTPAGSTKQIQIARAAPGISAVTCTRNPTGFTVVVDGYSNTREATQATFDFQGATGVNLGTSELIVTATPLFSSWFGGTGSAAAGGLFRYTQPFSVQGNSTDVASVSVKLANVAGTSAAATCQVQ